MFLILRAGDCSSYLERAAHSEDTVVSLLGRKTLESKLDGLGLLRDQVIGPTEREVLELVERVGG